MLDLIPPWRDLEPRFRGLLLLDEFARVLAEFDTRALLLGGVAVTSYGYARLTEDTDWWIDPTGGSIQWARRVLK